MTGGDQSAAASPPHGPDTGLDAGLAPGLTPAWPDRAAWGTAPSLRA